jgi:hypothetical protein
VLIGALPFRQGVVSNIVELEAHRGASPRVPVSAEVTALQDLQALCAEAIAAGGLDEARTLDLTVAVHRALKGSEWNVRFFRGQATGL